MEDEKIYLNCPFDDKDECKSLGGRWDSDARKWYITDAMASEAFVKWMDGGDASAEVSKPEAEQEDGERVYLNCPFDDKDECKALGGRWDGDAKKWYVPAGKDTTPFSKWI